jgi:4-hydroxybutyrate dehydrogenase
MIAVPTTAGTGSEVGRSGVVTLDVNHRKTVIFSPYLLANAAILDPSMTRTMPPHVTAATGFDALTHCIEAYVARGDHPMADGIAFEGIRLCAAHLERAVAHGDDLEARGGMLEAAMMGAVAFQKGLGACHSLAHPLSSEHGVHHGLANALCLPAVVEFNGGVAGERLGRVAALLGGKFDSLDAHACADVLRALRARIGLPGGLAAAGVPRGNLDRLADLAFQDACHTLNPRACTRDDLRALYEASF